MYQNFDKNENKIVVEAYKSDWNLYRKWHDVYILRNTPNHFVLLINNTKVEEIPFKIWKYQHPVIWFLPKNQMYNALTTLKENENYIYINMASKPILENKILKFIDYDLDIKSYPGKQFRIVDKEEFIENSKVYKYSKNIVDNIFNDLNDLVNKYNNFNYFFNEQVVNYYISLAKKYKILTPNFRKNKKEKTNFIENKKNEKIKTNNKIFINKPKDKIIEKRQ
ncbi:DUF402 domain-containing protein [Mycoplasmopsis lipophila]|uniref:DUF402 domain-containing protein n=1 Tax=Mycoplasmopsis lipophila TaxID=2117 RepID=UPI0038730816